MRLFTCSTALAVSLLAVCTLSAQTPQIPSTSDEGQEFALTIGSLSGTSPSAVGGPLALGSGLVIEGDFANKLRTMKWANLYWEAAGLINPFRHLSGTPGAATSEIRSVYVMPGARLQFTPNDVLSPWISVDGGLAIYDARSTSVSGGQTGGGTGTDGGGNATGAAGFGAGVDIKAGKKYLIRGDVRGIYSGSPNFGVPTPGGQFNFIIGGGFVWRFSK